MVQPPLKPMGSTLGVFPSLPSVSCLGSKVLGLIENNPQEIE
jgi:hypothetical protein